MKVDIKYNPYKPETVVLINGKDICAIESLSNFKEFIEMKIPLQAWIEQIEYKNWKGFLNELADDERNDKIDFSFSGRKIDYQDFKHCIQAQNKSRKTNTKIELSFEHTQVLDDKKMTNDIDKIVKELKSDWFAELVKPRESENLKNLYNDLDNNYKRAKAAEFNVAFSGIYSSGKSTIINCLTGHDVLPTSSEIRTSKMCRIKHDKTLSNEITLLCYDKDNNIVVEKETFTNDADCKARLDEISPKDSKNIKEEFDAVDTIELGMNLSALYPKSVDDDKLNLVLIDTPGTSGTEDEDDDGNNLHEIIARNAILDDDQPIVVFCAQINLLQNANIKDYMKDIVQKNTEDKGIFKDRFIFLISRADELDLDNGQEISDVKTRYAEKLVKFNDYKGDEAKCVFVPKIYFASALVDQAISNEAYNYSSEITKYDNQKKKEKKTLSYFKENIIDDEDTNYLLTENSDISIYRKNQLAKAYKEALNKGDVYEALKLQDGMNGLKYAIQDYIERYIYPMKVRDLLKTFEAITKDVKSDSDKMLSKLKEAQENLGKNQDERKEAIERKKHSEKIKNALESAKTDIDICIEKIQKITFDDVTLGLAVTEFMTEMERNSYIKDARNRKKSHNTDKVTRGGLESIDRDFKGVRDTFDSASKKMKQKFISVADKHTDQVNEVCNHIFEVIQTIKGYEFLENKDYDFANSAIWQLNFSGINPQKLTSLIKGRANVSNKMETRYNNKRLELEYGNFLQRIVAKFHRKYKEYSYQETKYSILPLIEYLDKSYIVLKKEKEEMSNFYKDEIERKKSAAIELCQDLKKEIDFAELELQNRIRKIKELTKDEMMLEEELNKQINLNNNLSLLLEKMEVM